MSIVSEPPHAMEAELAISRVDSRMLHRLPSAIRIQTYQQVGERYLPKAGCSLCILSSCTFSSVECRSQCG
jgi:hypothetical protein